jgi:hypothetical protein
MERQVQLKEQSLSGAEREEPGAEQSASGTECKVSRTEQSVSGAKALSGEHGAIRDHHERKELSAEQSASEAER